MTRQFTGLDPARVRDSLARVWDEISSAGRDPAEVEICAAIKYVAAEELPALAEAGVVLVGENRAQELLDKRAEHGDLFAWDFIGALQSRKVRDVAPSVRLIHSVASDSVLAQLAKHPALEVLIQVNVAGERQKSGCRPDEAAALLAAIAATDMLTARGLMTIAPIDARGDALRAVFRDLRHLRDHLREFPGGEALTELSMGMSGDYPDAIAEGATQVRIGSAIFGQR